MIAGIFEGGKALLMIARIPSTIRNYRLSTKKKPRNHFYPFFLQFLKKVSGSASKMNCLGLKLGKVFRKLAALIPPPFSKESSSWAANGPYANYTTKPSFILNYSLVCERYSSHWHFLCMSILFNPFIHVNRRKLALNWLTLWNLLLCVNMHKGYLLLTLWNIY